MQPEKEIHQASSTERAFVNGFVPVPFLRSQLHSIGRELEIRHVRKNLSSNRERKNETASIYTY
jgi:hypothetical protein